MKFLKHLFSVTKEKSQSSSSIGRMIMGGVSYRVASRPKSFGEKRACQMNSALDTAIKERKDLVRKQFISPNPLNTIFKQRGHRLDAQIRRLKDR